MKCFNISLPNNNVCDFEKNGIYQQVVFIRKTDLKSYQINSRIEPHEFINPTAYHRIKFQLKENTKGYRLNLNENSSILTASFSKSEKDGLPRYQHKITIGVFGNSEYYKWFLKQFDLSDEYFAVIQRKSDLIEVYGFHNGFTTSSYDYEDNSTITLQSLINENDLPYIYESDLFGKEITDFEGDFNNIPIDLNDFNNDYNNDFNN